MLVHAIAQVDGASDDPSLVLEVVRFGVPGALALLGVFVGKVWERRGGHRAWLRQERLRSYSEFLSVAWTLFRRMIEVHQLDEIGQGLPAMVEMRQASTWAVIELTTELQGRLASIRLLGPDAVVLAGTALRDALGAYHAAPKDSSRSTLSAAVEAAEQAFVESTTGALAES